jgi:hypothetical protein
LAGGRGGGDEGLTKAVAVVSTKRTRSNRNVRARCNEVGVGGLFLQGLPERCTEFEVNGVRAPPKTGILESCVPLGASSTRSR